jgi:hypothetical protein
MLRLGEEGLEDLGTVVEDAADVGGEFASVGEDGEDFVDGAGEEDGGFHRDWMSGASRDCAMIRAGVELYTLPRSREWVSRGIGVALAAVATAG